MTEPKLAEWTAAGLYDPGRDRAEDRLALLHWLDEQGITLDEMVRADADGRLFAVVGDRILRGSDPRLTSEECAAAAEIPVDRFLALWRALGFPDPRPEDRLLTAVEAATFAVVAMADSVLGSMETDSLVMTISRAVRIIAEATNTAFIEADDSTMLDRSGSELTTAQMDALYDGMIPLFHRWLVVLHALHHESSNRHLEMAFGLGDHRDEAVRLAVGFADVTEYTTMSNRLSSADLARIVADFERWAADVVRQDGAHLVKTLGDGLMFVGSLEAVGRAAVRLTEPGAAPGDLQLHAGIGYGAVLARGGDYFGPVVNLAARLCGAAPEGVVLADTTSAEAWRDVGAAAPAGQRTLKGIEQPVDVWALGPARMSPSHMIPGRIDPRPA